MVQHFGALEADFQRYYAMNLREEAFEGGSTPARLANLARNLPPECQTFKDIDPASAWTLDHELLAQLIELTDVRFLGMMSDQKHNMTKKALHVPRPWEGRPKRRSPNRRKATTRDVAMILGPPRKAGDE